jgi:beta-lactamase superfamily II metal-dependent hydrolase
MNGLKIHFLNVGNGDCTIIELPDGNLMMIDIFNGNNFNYYSKTINPITYLKNNFKTKEIYRYIQTHPEMDHMDGLNELRKNFQIINFWDTENKRPEPNFNTPYAIGTKNDWLAYQDLRKNSLKFYRGDVVDKAKNSNLYLYKIYVLHPTKSIVSEINNSQSPKWNNLSYVFILEYEKFKLLYSGDVETPIWEDIYDWVIKNNKENWLKNINVFKVSHHGRRNGYCGFEILNLANPQYIIISKGSVDPKDYAYPHYYQFVQGKNKIFITSQGKILVDYYDTNNKYYRINYEQR